MITSEDLYRQLMELNVSALCVNLFLNASEMPSHQVERVYNLRNNIIKASEMIVQYEKENPQKLLAD